MAVLDVCRFMEAAPTRMHRALRAIDFDAMNDDDAGSRRQPATRHTPVGKAGDLTLDLTDRELLNLRIAATRSSRGPVAI